MADRNAELAVEMADEWLGKNRKTDTWRLVNMLRDELVRSQDRVNTSKVTEKPLVDISSAEAWRETVDNPELRELLGSLDGQTLVKAFETWWNSYRFTMRTLVAVKTKPSDSIDLGLVKSLSDDAVLRELTRDYVSSDQIEDSDPLWIAPHHLVTGIPKVRDIDAEATAWYEHLKDSDFKVALSTLGTRDLTTAYLEWWASYSEGIREAPSNRRGQGVSEKDAMAAAEKATADVIIQLP